MHAKFIVLPLLMVAGCAFGAGFQDNLTGDWGGVRQTLLDDGVNVAAGYQNNYAANLSGGERKTSAYAGQWNLGFDFDLQRLVHWDGGSFHIMMTKRNGSGIEQRAGITSYDTIQQLFGTGSVTRLFRLYLRQNFWGDKLTLEYGRMDLGMNFYLFGCDFMAHIFCGDDASHVGQDIMNWPRAETGGVIIFRPSASWTFKLSRFNVNPNNAREAFFIRPSGPTVGHLSVGEVDLNTELGGSGGAALEGTWGIGGWRDTAPHPDLYLGANGLPLAWDGDMEAMVRGSNGGAYVLGRQQLTHNAAGGGLVVLGSFVQSSGTVNRIDQEATLAVEWLAPFASRPKDRIGFAIGSIRTSRHAALAIGAANAVNGTDDPIPKRQYNAELNYNIHLWRGVQLLPNIQYIMYPAGLRSLHDVTVFGTQLTVTL